MVGLKRMQNLQDCITAIEEDGFAGNLIETGVCGVAVAVFSCAGTPGVGPHQSHRVGGGLVRGSPGPEQAGPPSGRWAGFHEQKGLFVGEQVVRHNFERYGLLDDNVVFLKGWFKDMLPTAPIDKLALIRLDGDLCESTIQALDALYPKLESSGFCNVDDWMLVDQAQRAPQNYGKEHGITETVIDIDGTGASWRKSR